jgi:hypothetical protein
VGTELNAADHHVVNEGKIEQGYPKGGGGGEDEVGGEGGGVNLKMATPK